MRVGIKVDDLGTLTLDEASAVASRVEQIATVARKVEAAIAKVVEGT